MNESLDKINFNNTKYSKYMPKIESKATLDATRKVFDLLPTDEYQLIISKIEPKTQLKYQSKDTEDVVNVTLEITGFRDGNPAVDEKGNSANGRKMFFTLRPESMGFTKAGVASISRQLVMYAMEQSIDGDLELQSWDELLGKTVYAEIIQKKNMKGEMVNRIGRFLKSPRRQGS